MDRDRLSERSGMTIMTEGHMTEGQTFYLIRLGLIAAIPYGHLEKLRIRLATLIEDTPRP